MQHNQSTAELVSQLRKVGLRPSERTIVAILERGAEAVQPLTELALDIQTMLGAEPASLGPVHALRLLGELRPVEVAEPLLRRLPLPAPDEPNQAIFLWDQEAPQIVARFGPDVLPTVQRIADDTTAPPEQRGAAATALSFLAAVAPDLRDAIIADLRTRLQQETDPTVKGYVVEALAELQAREAYNEIMQAYRDKTVDRNIISAADARQLLLGSQQRQLDCALHTLEERYAQHGPYSEEQRRMMAAMAQNR